MSWACKVLCWQVLQAACTILCWSANCHILHPEENLDTCYSSSCPSKWTATKYALQMERSTTIPNAIFRNAVSDALMLSPRPHQPHWNRLTPGFPDLCHSLPQPLNEHHNQLHPWPRSKPCCSSYYTCSHAKGHPSTYIHLYTKCSTCATMKVRPWATQNPNASSQRYNWRSDCPWPYKWCTWPRTPMDHISYCALRHWTISLAQAP